MENTQIFGNAFFTGDELMSVKYIIYDENVLVSSVRLVQNL